MFILMLLLAFYVALSAIPVNAQTADNASGSSISSDVDGTSYLQEELEDITVHDFMNVYIIGVVVGLGCSTVLYIVGIGAGYFFAFLKKNL